MVKTPARPLPPPRGLVQVRTPSYMRPGFLKRCLTALQAQTWADWVCDVQDDSEGDECAAVVSALGDPRIFYRRNSPRLYASRNIDRCFSRENPRGAGYFCVCEDDNWLMPGFMAANIALMEREGVEVVLRNQLVEVASGTKDARLSEDGLMEAAFVEGRYRPEIMRLSLLAGIGMSHGGLFWSERAVTDFEVHEEVSATLLESIRTFAIADDVWCAMEPLAVWVENGEETTRDAGFGSDFYRRKLPVKRSMMELQRRAWRAAPKDAREGFVDSARFAFPTDARARGLVKSGISLRTGAALPLSRKLDLYARGLVIRALARVEPGLARFLQARPNGAAQ